MRTTILFGLLGLVFPAGLAAKERCPDCKKYGLCKPVRGICSTSIKDCKGSDVCRTMGQCIHRGPHKMCGASEATCASSEYCKSGQTCSYDPLTDRCVSLAEKAALAKARTPPTEACETCKDDGRCIYAAGVGCMVGAASCAASVACAKSGRCTASPAHNLCVAVDDGACRASEDCRKHAQCEADRRWGTCRATVATCEVSEACKLMGWCGVHKGSGTCAATKAGCAASARCKTGGDCRLVDGFCGK